MAVRCTPGVCKLYVACQVCASCTLHARCVPAVRCRLGVCQLYVACQVCASCTLYARCVPAVRCTPGVCQLYVACQVCATVQVYAYKIDPTTGKAEAMCMQSAGGAAPFKMKPSLLHVACCRAVCCVVWCMLRDSSEHVATGARLQQWPYRHALRRAVPCVALSVACCMLSVACCMLHVVCCNPALHASSYSHVAHLTATDCVAAKHAPKPCRVDAACVCAIWWGRMPLGTSTCYITIDHKVKHMLLVRSP
jgi:hypothetical protein